MTDDLVYRAGSRPEEGGYPGFAPETLEENGMLIEKDVAITLRDGVVIYANVFRPVGQDNLPTLIGWAPYGKHSPIQWDLYTDAGVDGSRISRWTAFEGTDPTWWCPKGYAVVFPDIRGSWHSGGDLVVASHQEALDACDVIEWAGTRPWSNGKVGLAGVSYLAWSQWYIAAMKPPRLAAINPWEGVTDFYREFAFHGGIPDTNFLPAWQLVTSFSDHRVEDWPEMMKRHPLLDDYWRSKGARDLSAIEVPAYVVASWSDHGLHSRGTLEGFRRISSDHKWLEVHGRKKWQYFYEESSFARQLAFFDRFLKDGVGHNEVDEWPQVRLEVRDRAYEGTFRAEQEWPLSRTRYTELYLDTTAGSLSDKPLETASSKSYEATDDDGRLVFDHTFTEETELTGYAKLRLWLEIDEGSDADVFIGLEKLDANGNGVPFPFFSALNDGVVALGWLRASHRALDPARSMPFQPVHPHDKEVPMAPGRPEPLEIEIWPSSTRWQPGETLRLIVQGSDLRKYETGTHTNRHDDRRNTGRHIVHGGGAYDSYLLVPVIPSPDGL
ncbi:CocE/NonD family hydrolase [Streptomyces sp. NBC_01217]|uniref:CocE/NonD family hydrolase n=1 Tax=Streptomyces sp. NBC_01217 TaxID=2903779 RepID=UPI002E100939|nr:CocE/NonD family hydrolase [Streptomyces sp. NBC_01217]